MFRVATDFAAIEVCIRDFRFQVTASGFRGIEAGRRIRPNHFCGEAIPDKTELDVPPHKVPFCGVSIVRRDIMKLRENDWSDIKRLVLICAHGVHKGGIYLHNDGDAGWHIRDYQRGQTGVFVAQLRAGIEAAALDPDAMLMVSGGPTLHAAGPRSEALSYVELAFARGFWGAIDVASRTVTEEAALCSHLNYLNALCRFAECCDGRWPESVQVISLSLIHI